MSKSIYARCGVVMRGSISYESQLLCTFRRTTSRYHPYLLPNDASFKLNPPFVLGAVKVPNGPATGPPSPAGTAVCGVGIGCGFTLVAVMVFCGVGFTTLPG